MSKFGRYGGGDNPRLPGAATGRELAPQAGPSLLDQARATKSASIRAERIVAGPSAQFAIALDATGSMAGLIDDAKASVRQIIRRVTAEAGVPIEIELFAYRDYDCPQHLLLERSKLSADPGQLEQWLKGIEAVGGGGNQGEAVEAALEAIVASQGFGCVLVAGDEPSNPSSHIRSHGRSTPTALDLAKTLGSSKAPVHTFVVGQRASTTTDFKRLAEASGGRSGRLDGSREMIDMAVMAMLASLTGVGGVRRYMDKTPLTKNAADFGAVLLLPAK